MIYNNRIADRTEVLNLVPATRTVAKANVRDFKVVFERLRAILTPYAANLVITIDAPDQYYLDTRQLGPNKKPIFFASVWIKKNYVSFYLMPVYMFPDLLDNISDGLKKRMQGKSCFNFSRVDEALIEELTNLTATSVARFRSRSIN